MRDQPIQSLIRRPVCPDCRKPMRYATSELDKTRPVRRVMFVCDCGHTSNQVVWEI
jgi:RNase P subunit RPR2